MPNLDESIEELPKSPTAVTAPWPGPPASPRLLVRQPGHSRHELIGAGMLILAGGGHGLPPDYDELERWTRVGFERGMRSRKGER